MPMRYRVAAVIPAHNEELTISQAVRDLAAQSHAVDLIVVVNDRSTDRTGQVLDALQEEVPQLAAVRNERPLLRAGAVNCGLEYLMNLDKPVDLVVVADADSRFDPDLVSAAAAMFDKYPRLGGVCTTAGVLDLLRPEGSFLKRSAAWLLWRLQRLDCAGFDATRTATWANVQILHGLCSVFRFDALRSVGGYSSGHLLEDYDLTLRLKKAGWQAMYCPQMKASTRVPVTFGGFFRQRARWMRGGFDILLRHGISRHTAEDVLNHALFIALFLGVAAHIGISIAGGGWRPGFIPQPLPIILAGLNYIWSFHRLRFIERLEPGDVIICAALIPELLLAVALSVFQLQAYYRSLLRRSQNW